MDKTRQAVETVFFLDLISKLSSKKMGILVLFLFICAVYKILCFNLSDGDFEIKSKLLVLFYSHFKFQNIFMLQNLFLFIFS